MKTKNPLGSQTFGTTQVRTDEYILMAKVMQENGESTKQIALNIEAIDDMLSLQRVQSISRYMAYTKTGRKRKNILLSDLLGNRIDKLIEDSKTIVG